MRNVVVFLVAAACLAACGDDGRLDITRKKRSKEAKDTAIVVGVPATRTNRLDFAACLVDDVTDETAQSRCPSFALLSLDYMSTKCAMHGGKLKARQPSDAWSLDVDGDGGAEILVDLAGNFECEGVPAVFACGNIDCPFLLYKQRVDAWTEIGAINGYDAPAIEILPAEAGKYAPLRGGCYGQQPCTEFTYYEWDGQKYDRTWIDFKGQVVDVVPGGLMTITQDAAVRDAPHAKRGQLLDEYPVGTAMIVIGTARDEPWSFVSPCSSCRRGFIETALLQKQQ
jgi:hypothetical protein